MCPAIKPETARKIAVKGLDTYAGGKGAAGTYQKVINHVRPCERFVELCLGGGSVSRWMKPARYHVGVDVDERIISLWAGMQFDWLELRHQSALAYLRELEQLQDLSRTVLYFDPPYPRSSRKSQQDLYKHEMTDAGHVAILEVLLRLAQRPDRPDILISSYPNELYAQLLKGWQYETFQSTTRQGPATEILYWNFGEVNALHDTRFVGENFRERWRRKKRERRWVANFNKMPQLERQAIFKLLAADATNYEPDMTLTAAPVVQSCSAGAGAPGHQNKLPQQLTMFGSSTAVNGAVVEASRQ